MNGSNNNLLYRFTFICNLSSVTQTCARLILLTACVKMKEMLKLRNTSHIGLASMQVSCCFIFFFSYMEMKRKFAFSSSLFV